MEDRDLVILGLTLRHISHRLLVSDDARRVRNIVPW